MRMTSACKFVAMLRSHLFRGDTCYLNALLVILVVVVMVVNKKIQKIVIIPTTFLPSFLSSFPPFFLFFSFLPFQCLDSTNPHCPLEFRLP